MCWFVKVHVTIHLTFSTFECAVHWFRRWCRTCLVAVTNVHTHMVAQLILLSAEMILKKPKHLNALWGKVFHCSWSVEEFIQKMVQFIIFRLSFYICWLLLKPSVQHNTVVFCLTCWFSVLSLSSLQVEEDRKVREIIVLWHEKCRACDKIGSTLCWCRWDFEKDQIQTNPHP